MLSVLCVFGQMSSYSSSANRVSALTDLTAEEITSQMTIGWNLGNSLDSYNNSLSSSASPSKFATSWGNPEPTKELIETVKNAGFNTIRIPTTWYQHVTLNDQGVYEVDQAWMDYVKQVVDYAYDLDMFVILNLHHEEGIINVEEFTDETLATASQYINNVWSQIAYTFKDYDQHLIFEGMNEPRQTNNENVSEWGNGSGDDGYSWAYINTLNRQFISTVRSSSSEYNQQRLLMVPAYVATTDVQALNSLSISSSDGNVAISVHAYSPYFFTMDTGEYSNHSFPGKSGYGEDYEASLSKLFSNLQSVSESKGVPIIIGEFSASDFNNTEDRVEWAKCYLSYAKSAGIPCVLWDNNVCYNENKGDNGEAHGYFYRLTNTVYPNSADVLAAMMDTVGVTDYVLPEYQKYVAPTFSWSGVNLKDGSVAVYREEKGETLDSWDNVCLSDWEEYLSEGYDLALVSDSSASVEVVLQDSANSGWYRVTSDDSRNSTFVTYFTYEDMLAVLEANGATFDDVDNLFISATTSKATMYGLFAVPTSDVDATTTTDSTPDVTTTTDSTTDGTTTTTVVVVGGALPGDANADGSVDGRDLILLKKYSMGLVTEDGIDVANSDVNGDSVINGLDLILLKKYVLGLTTLG
jgi:aryl-phospho-beta-D-glucosidase BglC (GH1 family)